jgi:hypothetical protein
VKINELVIFLAHNVVSERIDISPRYVLTTANNQILYQYWRDKKNHSTLHYLLDNARLKRLYNEHKKDKKTSGV